ncbi:hypothetical protein QWJ46_00835 [Rhizobium sp. CBN3]|uniref:hypothetical protein n=1 Tax=Rhizobium sp. CBN3 TaxID=3058045 RepID=UPI00267339B9|nr:hypothetical protein [Rhizobium sp. CBN3]MDO3431220.1 hypothetical protein [Rhizobium sp. CBN3]
MTMEEFERIADQALVSIAAGHDAFWQGNLLEPRLWEDLRIEMQRRLRRSTGEPHAIVTFSFGGESA